MIKMDTYTNTSNNKMFKEEKLIELVKAHRAIYDKTDVLYRNKEYVTELWEQIAEQMDETVIACQKRWRYLRDYFGRQTKNYEQQQQLNDGGSSTSTFNNNNEGGTLQKKKSNWAFYEKMLFVEPYLTTRKSIRKSKNSNKKYKRRYKNNNNDNYQNEIIKSTATTSEVADTNNDNNENVFIVTDSDSSSNGFINNYQNLLRFNGIQYEENPELHQSEQQQKQYQQQQLQQFLQQQQQQQQFQQSLQLWQQQQQQQQQKLQTEEKDKENNDDLLLAATTRTENSKTLLLCVPMNADNSATNGNYPSCSSSSSSFSEAGEVEQVRLSEDVRKNTENREVNGCKSRKRKAQKIDYPSNCSSDSEKEQQQQQQNYSKQPADKNVKNTENNEYYVLKKSKSKKRIKHPNMCEQLLETLKNLNDFEHCRDDNYYFFMSLLKHMRKIKDDLTLSFRTEIIQIVMKYNHLSRQDKEDDNDDDNGSSNSDVLVADTGEMRLKNFPS